MFIFNVCVVCSLKIFCFESHPTSQLVSDIMDDNVDLDETMCSLLDQSFDTLVREEKIMREKENEDLMEEINTEEIEKVYSQRQLKKRKAVEEKAEELKRVQNERLRKEISHFSKNLSKLSEIRR